MVCLSTMKGDSRMAESTRGEKYKRLPITIHKHRVTNVTISAVNPVEYRNTIICCKQHTFVMEYNIFNVVILLWVKQYITNLTIHICEFLLLLCGVTNKKQQQ